MGLNSLKALPLAPNILGWLFVIPMIYLLGGKRSIQAALYRSKPKKPCRAVREICGSALRGGVRAIRDLRKRRFMRETGPGIVPNRKNREWRINAPCSAARGTIA